MLEINKNNSNTNSSGLIINHNTSSDNNNNKDSSSSFEGGYNILAAFDNITLVGDSLTQASGGRKRWAQILADRTGAVVRAYAQGGDTPKQWFRDFNNDQRFNNMFNQSNVNYNPYDSSVVDQDYAALYPKATGPLKRQYTPFGTPGGTALNENYNQKRSNQLAIIYLGTNDGLVRDREYDEQTIRDDQVHFYRQIVQDFLDVHARVLLLHTKKADVIEWNLTDSNYRFNSTKEKYEHYHTVEETNDAIDEIADKMEVAVIDIPFLSNPIWRTSYKYDLTQATDILHTDGTHYGSFGYAAFVDQLIQGTGNLKSEMLQRIIPHSETFEENNFASS